MNKLLVILGPTSTGKTDLALRLASPHSCKLNAASLAQGELVSCDSRQVYKGLDIGTGKMPGKEVKVKKGQGFWEMDGVRVWMYDVVDPKKQYTVYHYVKDANKVIEDILKRRRLPIIVGGTGLYLKAMLLGLPSLAIGVDKKLRKQLNNLTMKQLQQRLQEVDRKKWESLNNSDRQNPRRLIRAIELSTMSLRGLAAGEDVAIFQGRRVDGDGRFLTAFGMTRGISGSCFDVLKLGLTAPREILYKRIDERVVSRIREGMIEEVKKLHKSGLSLKRMRQLGLEYGVLADFLQGRIKTEDELVKIMQSKIHGFARRQITWFKKENPSTHSIDTQVFDSEGMSPQAQTRRGRTEQSRSATGSGCIYWFDISEKNYLHKVEELINKWYDIE